MPDLGSAYYPLNEASGSVAYDSGGLHNGSYLFQTYPSYSPPYNPTTQAPLLYRVAAPSLSGYAVGLRSIPNGRPAWSTSYNYSYISIPTVAFGWGNMYLKQEFTISMLVRWHGFGSAFISAATYVSGSGSYGWATGMYTPTNNQGYSYGEPKLITFARFTGGGISRIISSVDTPAGVDYNAWDDWDGGIYQEPLKIGVWFRLVLRFDGNYKSIWINGVKVAEDSAPDPISIVQNQSLPIQIGPMTNMDVAELGIWHVALTDEQISG